MTYLLGCSKFHKIKVGKEAPAPLKGRVFKIETLNISSSALATEICAGPHNRLLRRQHCSSLCSQSEGHEHVANMASASGHDFVGFSARAWPPQYSSPSLCEQSELQCCASDLRRRFARRLLLQRRTAILFGSKPRRDFSGFRTPYLPSRQRNCQFSPESKKSVLEV